MRKIAIIFILVILSGAGCQKTGDIVLNDGKISRILAITGNNFGWLDSVETEAPNEGNNYGDSVAIYGNYREKAGELDTFRNSLEVIKFETPAYAERAYGGDDCLKGKGVPFEVAGVTACCLNDKEKEMSRAIMKKENYIFRSFDYFHAGCRAAEYLKAFWKNYR